ncbi:MAG TPA: LCP family protein [Jatrophihabitans sp.]|nr:LCP family protein [Jatrophihabitans sp.]
MTAPAGSAGERRRRRRISLRRRLLAAAGAVVLLAVTVVAAGYGYVQWRFHQIRRETVAGLVPVTGVPADATHPSVSAGKAPYTVLLVGDNCRACLDGSQASSFGSAADVGGGRSDVTMLLRVDQATDRVAILSVPRDLWLPVPNSSSEIRVDAALNNGPAALVSTIEDSLGIGINHYVELNFDTFQQVVNALGAVNMYFPTRLYDSYSSLNVPAGCYHLTGTQALAVVRARHTYYQQGGVWQYDGLGDISRIQRDHEFLTILGAAVAAQGLGNPIVDNNLITSVVKDVTIDSRFTLGGLTQLAQIVSHVHVGTVPQTTLPVDEDNSPNGFVYRGAQYGDVVFPANAGDLAAIRSFLGTGAEAGTGTLPVTVINGSGLAGQQDQVARQLRALGFPVRAVTAGPVDSSPAETVVYYGPGHQPQAQALAQRLGGAVALGLDAGLAGSGLTLVTGSNLTVAAATHGAAGSSTATAPTAGPPATAPTAGPPAAAPIGGVTQASPTYPAFDPRSCPAGTPARPLPSLPVPAAARLPSS